MMLAILLVAAGISIGACLGPVLRAINDWRHDRRDRRDRRKPVATLRLVPRAEVRSNKRGRR
jgi:hypothetical protein